MNKIRLGLSIGMLALTIGVGLTCTLGTATAENRECNCFVEATGQGGLKCYQDGTLRCCTGGCYEIVAIMEAEN